jgi:hypothetical protein
MLHRHRSPALFPVTLALVLAALSSTACKAPQAFGDRNSLIVHADSTLWAQVDSAFLETVERRVFTNRPERMFNVTFVATGDTLWRNLRQWNQVVLIGTREHPVVERLADRAEEEPPTIFQAPEVWARGQTVTVVLLPSESPASAARETFPALSELLESRYANWIRQRMYASGVNDSLASVLATFGFSLRLPRVYSHTREDSVFRFRSAYPDPASLLRSVLVTWEVNAASPTPSELRAWREERAEELYLPPQDVLDEGIRYDTVPVGPRAAIELRGVWQDRSEFPAAGPFITRAVPCPEQDRLYYLDGWVYAPGKDKHLYLVQIEHILDSFSCAEEDPIRISRDRAANETSALTTAR